MDRVCLSLRAFSVTWWSVAGLLSGTGEALRKVAFHLHLAVHAF
jgi:hypothetical protein